MKILWQLFPFVVTILAAGGFSSADQGAETSITETSFKSADSNRDLKISRDEFTSYYPGDNAPRVFSSLNRDNDAYLDQTEFRAMQNFSLWDLDFDRSISREEFTSYYRGPDGVDVFRKLDINNDGSLDDVEFNIIQNMP